MLVVSLLSTFVVVVVVVGGAFSFLLVLLGFFCSLCRRLLAPDSASLQCEDVSASATLLTAETGCLPKASQGRREGVWPLTG